MNSLARRRTARPSRTSVPHVRPKKYPGEGQLIKPKAGAAGSFGCRNAPVKFCTKGTRTTRLVPPTDR
ncbi:hypothetical protein [Streptomyces akebiae]|uniref:Uncharacterized protein n=1 Tax=Streptomyces akebiae TaxID=2865673 RepID=A0ABX8XYZ4_9ACTN|nr:hypothetical protein [Streptomyces akebiae]QYX81022.1 hypothetical protein K1J60_34785 [Streptomyces akebiae]